MNTSLSPQCLLKIAAIFVEGSAQVYANHLNNLVGFIPALSPESDDASRVLFLFDDAPDSYPEADLILDFSKQKNIRDARFYRFVTDENQHISSISSLPETFVPEQTMKYLAVHKPKKAFFEEAISTLPFDHWQLDFSNQSSGNPHKVQLFCEGTAFATLLLAYDLPSIEYLFRESSLLTRLAFFPNKNFITPTELVGFSDRILVKSNPVYENTPVSENDFLELYADFAVAGVQYAQLADTAFWRELCQQLGKKLTSNKNPFIEELYAQCNPEMPISLCFNLNQNPHRACYISGKQVVIHDLSRASFQLPMYFDIFHWMMHDPDHPLTFTDDFLQSVAVLLDEKHQRLGNNESWTSYIQLYLLYTWASEHTSDELKHLSEQLIQHLLHLMKSTT